MRKVLLFLFLLNFIPKIKSQTMFCPPGATWNYALKSGIAGVDGIVEYKYSSDTIFNSVQCKFINATFRGWKIGISYLGNNITIPQVNGYFVYENNKVEYLYNGSSFDTIVNFGASIGDKWREVYKSNSYCSNKRGYFTVTDTDHVNFNSFSLKRIKVNYTPIAANGSAGTPSLITPFVERILFQSSINDNQYGEMFFHYCDFGTMIADFPNFYLLCYQDHTFPTYKTSARNCDDLTSIQESKVIRNAVKIFPNPTTDLITIQFPNSNGDFDFRLIDVLGQIHLESQTHLSTALKMTNEKEIQINISNLKNGIYFLQVWDKGKLTFTEKLIKQ